VKAETTKQHQWLQKLVGEWTFEGGGIAEPGQAEPKKFTGTERVRSLGGLWVLAESEGQMPDGGPATTLMTLGFDPQKQRFIGTWVGSMMTALWVYNGTLDASERVLTLETEGPDMRETSKVTKYRDIIELRSDDYRVMTSETPGEDGQWHRFMLMEYRRTK
jgi:hypothetical protein